MLRRTTLLALALIASGAVAAELPKQITIATEGAYPPWNFTQPDGSVVGYEIHLIKVLCEKMQIECKVITQDWDGIIPGLNAGKYDAIIASMGVTEERKKVVSFSIPYARAPNGFLTTGNGSLTNLPGAGSSFRQVAGRGDQGDRGYEGGSQGKTVGVQTGTTAASFADAYLKNLTLAEYPSFEQPGLELTAGRLDVAIANVTAFKAVIDANPAGTLVLTGPTFSGGVLGLGTTNVALRPADADLLKAFDAAIDAVNKDGTNNALRKVVRRGYFHPRLRALRDGFAALPGGAVRSPDGLFGVHSISCAGKFMFESIGSFPSPLTLFFDERPIAARQGKTIAACLLRAGAEYFRTTPVSASPRLPYCMIGHCFECLVEVDGVGNRQACLTLVQEGMRVCRQVGAVALLSQASQ